MAVASATVALRLVGGVVLLFANAFFVTTEFAMTRVRQFPRDAFSGDPGLERAWEMTERLEVYLSGCQVGITIASVGLGVVAEPAVSGVLRALGLPGGHATAALVALAIINLLHVVVGEQMPTYLGVERTRTIARYCAPALYWWTRVMYPAIAVADRLAKALLRPLGVEITRSWTEAEMEGEAEGALGRGALLSEMGDVLARSGVDRERRREVLNALAIGERPVESIAIPREEMVTLSTTRDPEENLRTVRETPQHTRFPLVGGMVDDLRGVVYATTVLTNVDRIRSGDRNFADLAVDAVTVPADLPVSDLVDRLQAESQEIALVVDPDRERGARGWVVGLVTISDAFEQIAGDVTDPLDVGPEGEEGDPMPPELEADTETTNDAMDESGADGNEDQNDDGRDGE